MKVTIHLLQVDEKGESFSIILVFKIYSSTSITNTQEVLKSITANKLMNIKLRFVEELPKTKEPITTLSLIDKRYFCFPVTK